MLAKRPAQLISYLLFTTFFLIRCNEKVEERPPARAPVDYIKALPGKSDSVPVAVAEKGKVLIAYSDCYTCHKLDQRSVGPAFTDIAKRYPVNNGYIELLAQKVIQGGSRSWGYAVMAPHPKLSVEDAKMMVSYILSLRE